MALQRYAICVSLCLVAAACAPSPAKQLEQRNALISDADEALRRHEVCCNSFEGIPTIDQKWPTAGTHFSLDAGSEVGIFGNDKSFFLAFKLSQELPSRKLLIKQSLVKERVAPNAPAAIWSSTSGIGSGYVLNPYVAFLDANKKLIREVNAPICGHGGSNLRTSGIFASATAPKDAVYAVLFTRKGVKEGFSQDYHSESGGLGYLLAFNGSVTIYFGPTGDLELGIVSDEQSDALRGSNDCKAVNEEWAR
jgi:hypothetical protein